MDFFSIACLLLGSTFGLSLRILIKKNLKIKAGFYIKNISFINFLATLLLGIFVALNLINKNINLFFFVGFLGCLSTFSSFIYQLFFLFRKKQFIILFLHYFEVLILSFLLFYIGFYLTKIIFT